MLIRKLAIVIEINQEMKNENNYVKNKLTKNAVFLYNRKILILFVNNSDKRLNKYLS